MLSKLGIRPFSYGLIVPSVFDNGSVFSPDVLNLTEDDVVEKFSLGLSMATSLALGISYPSLSAAPHILINGYKSTWSLQLRQSIPSHRLIRSMSTSRYVT